MNYNEKTKEAIIAELLQLQKNYDTLKKKYERDIPKFHQAKEIFQKMIDNSPRGMHFYKLNSKNELIFAGANPQADNILKIDNSQFIGKSIGVAFPPLLDTEIPEKYRDVAEKGIPWSTEHITYNDEKITGAFEIIAFQTTPGSMIAVFEDITKRKQSELLLKEKNREIERQNKEFSKINEELNRINEDLQKEKQKSEESEKQLQLIANNFVNGMLYQVATLTEEKRQFNYVSDAVEKLYGCSAIEAMRNPDLIYGKLHPDDIEELIQKEKEALKEMTVFKTEARVINPDGSIRWSYYVSKPRIIDGLICWDGIEIDISDQKKLELELTKAKDKAEENELQFKNIFESVADAVFIAEEKSGTIIDVNKAAERLMKMQKSDIIGLHQSELHPKENKKYTTETFRKHQHEANELLFSNLIENTVVCSDGTRVPVEILASKTTYKGKNCLIGIFRNITDRKKAEEKLRESEKKSKALLNATLDLAMLLDKDGKIIALNKAMANSLGYDITELIDKDIFKFLPVELGNTRRKWSEKAIKLKKTVKFIDNRGERWFENSIYPIFNNQGEILQFAIFSKNITEIKRANEAIKNSEYRFKTLSSVATEGIMIHENGIILDVNLAFAKLIGYDDPEILIGKNAFELTPLTPQSMKVVREHMKRNSKETYDVTLFDKKGALIQAQTMGVEIIYKGRKARLVYMIDISERKKAELELLREKEKAEESDRLKTAFLQNVSHEIRTPMNAIMGFSSLLAKNYDNKVKLEQFSEIINERCSDLLEIINDLLDISKIESGQVALKIEECNINELFTELYSFFSAQQKRIKKEHIEFKTQLQNDLPYFVIQTDKVKLKQILINLIGNAFKFTEKGSILCGCNLNQDQLIFYVSDTGIGIPAEKHDKIFERFTQLIHPKTKIYEGTGLGLSIARGLTELLGGKMWIESSQEKETHGTTFYFSIEYIKADFVSTNEKKVIENQDINYDKKTILIVEDDFYNAEYLKEVLSTNTNIHIIQTEFGKEAIHIATSQPIDLVLMDIRLPDLYGYEVTRIIKQSKPLLNIIAQTAYAAYDEKQKALDAGCVDYISKPIKQELLMKLISKYLIEK